MNIPAVPTRLTCALVLWALLACAAPASAQITINILTPGVGQTNGDPLPVSATVTSASEVTSVQATVSGHTIPLTFNAGTGRWTGDLPLPGVARRAS